MTRPALSIAREPPRQDAVRALLRAADAYFQSLYPAESNHLLDLAALERPAVRFFVARRGGRAVGCAAYVVQPPGAAEIKRLFVDPAARGQGVARALLARLEAEAAAEGIAMLRLETGVSQPAALALYRACGFAGRGPFGDYRADPLSLFLEKPLAGGRLTAERTGA